MALTHVDIALKGEDKERAKSFWNTYHCQNQLTSFEGRLYGNYCKNRFCPICSSIRKAEIINKYYPVISQWQQPYFVTLTVKACGKEMLKTIFENMLLNFRLIVEKYRKRNQRGYGVRLMGIKSLESNYNPERKTYNPHMHLIVASKEIAEILVKEWIAIFPKGYAGRQCQKYSSIYNLQKALIETIKYGTKVFSVPTIEKKALAKASGKIYAKAQYNVYEAMNGLRIFDRFGFNLPQTPPKP